MTRHMLAYDLAPGRFTCRAAAVVERDRHVLVGRTTSESIWYLPGGRVEWGETTREAAERELIEELGVPGQLGELAMVLENFFVHGGQRFHELAYYYPATLPDGFPFRSDGQVCHRGRDGDVELEFRWVPVDAESLRACAFRPLMLCGELASFGTAFRHVVIHDSSWMTGHA
jgi:ADP-ribose pyrophosphatase YjhB (NUDIX family)